LGDLAMENLKRKEGESIDSYQTRLTLALLDENSPHKDLEWEDIKELLSSNKHRDTLRREGYGIMIRERALREERKQCMSSDEVEKINEKIIELKKERVKSQDITNMLNKKVREQSRFEQMLECARDVASAFEKGKPLLSNVPVLRSGNKEAVVLLSDLHIGIVNDNYWNKYDIDIMKERMSYLKQRIIQIGLENNISRIRVVCIGDIISGLIHNTIRLENRLNICEQTVMAAEVISELLHSFSTLFKVDLYYAVGNHERISPNKSDSLDKENFGYMILEMIKYRCKDLKGLTIHENEVDDEIITFKVFNDKIVASHGHNFGNLNTYIPKITSMLGYVPDYVCLGHLHQPVEKAYGNTELIINPSFSGVDTFAKNLGLVGKPMQKLMLFSQEYGKEATFNINLDIEV
jgi:predicted phosphodiesterase